MSSSVQQLRQALGHRLREIRQGAELTGRQLAIDAGWHSSKVSKIEYGRQAPSESDIRIWCQAAAAADQIPDLIASVRHIESLHMDWRQVLGTGSKRRQKASQELEARTRLLRWYEPRLVPGLLQTAEYAGAILRKVIAFYGTPDDVELGVAARMERQQILYRGVHRFHFVLAEQALHTQVGDRSAMASQLDRLLTISALPRVRLGLIPDHAEYYCPVNQFIMYDDELVQVETISAELTITQPQEIALYGNAFQRLSKQAVYGKAALSLVEEALTQQRHRNA